MRWRGWRGCCNWEPTVSLFVFPEVIVICLFLLLWQDIMAIFGSTLYRFCLGRASQIVIQSCPFWMSHHLPTRSWHVPRHPNPPTITHVRTEVPEKASQWFLLLPGAARSSQNVKCPSEQHLTWPNWLGNSHSVKTFALIRKDLRTHTYA